MLTAFLSGWIFLAGTLQNADGFPNPGVWIDVPFVRQVEKGCGSASVSMVLRYWDQAGAVADAASDVRRIHELLYSADSGGISTKDMEQYFRAVGFDVYAFKGEYPDLENHLRKGRPLIVCLREGKNLLHYVVVTGVDPARSLLLVNDPARRKLHKIKRAEFEKDWKGADNYTLLALPRD